MEKKFTVGIIGLSVGRIHLDGAVRYGAEIGGICDLKEDFLEEMGEKYNIPAEKRFTDYRDILNNKEIDAVILATPDQLHRQQIVEFLDAGKHVMCEKPLALTREDIGAIVDAASKSDRKVMVGQICRFTPAFVKAKEIIDAGTIGDIYYVESEYAHDYMHILADMSIWRADPLRHGVIGGGCHAVDLLRWYVGDPVEVFAYGTHKLLPQVDYDDATISVLKFPNDIIGKVFVSTGCKRDYTMRTLIYGTKGTIICDNTSPTMRLYTVGENGMAEEYETIEVDVNNHNAAREFEVFADAIFDKTPLEMTATEGAKTVAACHAIVESAKSGMPVKPDYNF